MINTLRTQLRVALVALAVVAGIGVAYALNQDQTRNFPARLGQTQQTNYYRVLINFNDPNISTAQKFGALPQNSFILNTDVEIVTAFNAGTTNVLTIGTSTTANEIVASGDVTAGSTGVTSVSRGRGRSLTSSGDTTLYAKFTQTGAAATTGQAIVVIEYVPNNDM